MKNQRCILQCVLGNNDKKGLIAIRLHPRCPLPSSPSWLIGSIAGGPKFSAFLFALAWHTEWSLLLHDVIGDWMIPFAANAAATPQLWLHWRLPMFLNGPDNPRKMSFPTGGSAPHLMRSSWAHPSLRPKWDVDRFSHFCTAHRRVSHYFTMRHYNFPSKLPLSLGGSGPPSNTWYLWPIQVIVPNGTSIGSAVRGSQMLCRTMRLWERLFKRRFINGLTYYNALSMGKKTPKLPELPLPLGFLHPAGEGLSHGHRQHAEKNWKRLRTWFRRYLRGQTDGQTYEGCSKSFRPHWEILGIN